MPRPPDITRESLNNLRKLRSELEQQTRRDDLTIEETLNAVLTAGITDTGTVAPDPMQRIKTQVADEDFPT